MHIQHHNTSKNGSFFIAEGEEKLAEMTYVWSGENRFIIDHTEVSDRLRGQGAGNKLVMAAVDFARNNNYRILPLCPFAKSVFNKHPDLNDLLF